MIIRFKWVRGWVWLTGKNREVTEYTNTPNPFTYPTHDQMLAWFSNFIQQDHHEKTDTEEV